MSKILPFPHKFNEDQLADLILENQSHFSVDFGDVNPEEAEKIFSVMEFLSNRDVLRAKFSPQVTLFLQKEPPDPYKLAYKAGFEEFVISLIKNEVINHFPNMTPEEILLLTDKEVINFLTEGYYFDKDIYKETI